ncbi:hypothetical protein DSO57_1039388 [Entomophthora muscae]|uniref:Uncharacterized protein n=1 Tax=Entomophthora muscae TaxID=34485 RepID=A0ACC2UKE7_9FUNG|nr:hypothetical protein DSO57_1039388 [Entomophthora muscae]
MAFQARPASPVGVQPDSGMGRDRPGVFPSPSPGSATSNEGDSYCLSSPQRASHPGL